MFSLARHALGIRGKQKTAPNPLARPHESGTGLKVRLDNQLVPRVIPSLAVSNSEDGKVIVKGTYDAADKDRLIDDITKVLLRKGIETDAVQAKECAEKLIQSNSTFVATESSSLSVSFSIDTKDIQLLYLKIVYEIAYLELGANYIADTVAGVIRDAINSRAIASQLRGQIPVANDSIGSLLSDQTHHYVMLSSNAAYVSLFGLAGSFEYCGDSALAFSDEHSLIYDFDPVARSYKKSTVSEFLYNKFHDAGRL